MIEHAEKGDKIKPGDTLIEAPSGNTPSLNVSRVDPNSYILDQYANSENPAAHESGTAEESCWPTKGKWTWWSVALEQGAVTGLSRGLKKHKSDILVVGADPIGSVLAQPDSLDKLKDEYKVEGMGYEFVPAVLDQSEPSIWIKTFDRDSFQLVRRLVREEEVFCGRSSGAAIAALAQLVTGRPELNKEDKVAVVILPDGNSDLPVEVRERRVNGGAGIRFS
ncbi:hypothetical protein N7532_007774 [Penicillium argentinense]|uniref:Tryptophan synthase beta chain-like PALP domain-containing protein n=1 Tax=Penicillium argentinense TaxID=1131581 RepID=A0A9W9EWE4_9EURO|nr:uncharacterized protein N7532_007774 [Penicillium argentinense]KAJ5089090.1 hypothetical protein N7532_007774 [Penicillium argentinense]